MKHMKGAVIAAKNTLEIRDDCPLPDVSDIVPTGALVHPFIKPAIYND